MGNVTVGEGLRERKKQATRLALRDAAIRLMTEADPQSVTVEAICAEAGVSRRTFFNYFDSKEEALFAWDEEAGRRMTATIRDHAPGSSPFVAASVAVRDMFRRAVADKSQQPLQRLLTSHPDLVAAGMRVGRALEQAVAEGVAERTGREAGDLYVQTVSAAVSAGIRVVSRNWPHSPEEGIDALVAEVFALLETGAMPG